MSADIVMKGKYSSALVYVAAASLALAGCQEPAPEAFDRDSLSFSLEVQSTGANDVTVSVRHNGDSDLTYYGFCYRDFTLGETAAVEKTVADLKSSGTDISSVLTSGTETAITCTGLQSSSKYRFVVFGIDSDYNLYGTPASVYFDTPEGAVIYEENPDWKVTYEGKMASSDNAAFGDVIQVVVANGDNGYFARAIPKSRLDSEGIGACIEEAVAGQEEIFRMWEEEGYTVDRSDYVYYTTAGFLMDTDESEEYVGVAIGVDEEFRATGLYALSEPFIPEEVEYSTAYGKWLGEWTLSGTYTGTDGRQHTVSYDVSIDYLIPDQSYVLSGYQSDASNVMPDLTVRFDSATGALVFAGTFVEEAYVDNMFSQIYFYGTRTENQNLSYIESENPIANAAMESDSRAMVYALSQTQSDGTQFTPTEMQFLARTTSGWMTFSNPVPQFPFSMEKK